jgi:hypothetical protein
MEATGLDTLAAPDECRDVKQEDAWILGVTVGTGLAGMFLWKDHPVLGLLDGCAIGGNAARVRYRRITLRRAVENLGAHAVATAGALSLPAYPAVGYIGGVAASNLFISKRESLIERIDETVLGNPPARQLPAASQVGADAPATQTAAATPASMATVVGGLLATAAGIGIISAVGHRVVQRGSK